MTVALFADTDSDTLLSLEIPCVASHLPLPGFCHSASAKPLAL